MSLKMPFGKFKGVLIEDLPSVAPEVQMMAEELVTAGYRKLAQTYHPDHGGEGQAMMLSTWRQSSCGPW